MAGRKSPTRAGHSRGGVPRKLFSHPPTLAAGASALAVIGSTATATLVTVAALLPAALTALVIGAGWHPKVARAGRALWAGAVAEPLGVEAQLLELRPRCLQLPLSLGEFLCRAL